MAAIGTQAQAETGRNGRPVRLTHVALSGAAISGAAVAGFSGDWACSALSAAVVAGTICGVVGLGLRRLGQRRPGLYWGVLAAVAVLTAVVMTAWTRETLRQWAFRTTFGSDPPAAVRELRVARYYAGGPGDTLTLIRFRADPATVGRLVAALPTGEADDTLGEYRAGRIPWPQVWDRAFAMANGRRNGWWPAAAPPMAEPMLYRGRTAVSDPMPTGTTVVWDQATGEVFVMNTAG